MKKNWTYKKLGEVFDLQMGKTPSRDNVSYWGGSNVWISISDIKNKYVGDSKEHITDKAVADSKIKKINAGVVIMSFKLTVGRAAITTTDIYTNEAIMAFIPKDGYNLLPDYIYYYLKGHKWSGTNKAVMGLTLNKATISQNMIVLPPLPIQEKIVSELDCINGILDKKRQQLKELDALAQSLFYQMFGDPINNEKGWEVKKLGEVGDIVTGSTPSTNNPANWDGDINWVTPAELNTQLYYGATTRKLSIEGAKGLTIMPVGTVLLSSRAPIGKLAITTVPMCCNQGFKNIVCGTKLINIFLYYYLLLTMDEVKAMGCGATFKEVSKKAISSYNVPLPPLPLQQSFASKIEAIEKQKELIKQSIADIETLLASRMQYWFD